MPQLDFDGANSKISADKIQGQSGTTVTVPTGHKLAGTDANSITINGVNAVAVAPSTSGNVLTSNGSAWASSAPAGGGVVLQVLQNVKSDSQSISGNTFTTVLSQAITPSATSSKILVQFSLNVSGSVRYSAVNLYRDSTQIGMGDADGSMARVSVASMMNESASNGANVMFVSSFSFLDSPSSSSSVTFYVKCANTYTGNSYGTGATTYINRQASSGDADWSHAGASTLTVMEIGS